MKKCLLSLILLFLVTNLLLTGCGVASQRDSRIINDKLMELQVGMERKEALSLLGKPYKREVYPNSEFLIYETNHWATTENERFTPILIQDDKVVGWGRNFYDYTKKSQIDIEANIKTNNR